MYSLRDGITTLATLSAKKLPKIHHIRKREKKLMIHDSTQARAQFKRRSTANNVEILAPVPEDADSPRFRTNIGSVLYAPEKSAIIWKIKQFGGGKEFLMRAELGLPSVKGDDERGGGMTGGFGGSMGGAVGQGGKGKRPISVKFEIPYFTTSGIQVRYLKIIEPKVSSIALLFLLPLSAFVVFYAFPRYPFGAPKAPSRSARPTHSSVAASRPLQTKLRLCP